MPSWQCPALQCEDAQHTTDHPRPNLQRTKANTGTPRGWSPIASDPRHPLGIHVRKHKTSRCPHRQNRTAPCQALADHNRTGVILLRIHGIHQVYMRLRFSWSAASSIRRAACPSAVITALQNGPNTFLAKATPPRTTTACVPTDPAAMYQGAHDPTSQSF